MPRYELVIFDWDGTLMNSTDHIVECLQNAARDTGLPEPTAAAARHIIGLALPLAIEQLFPGVDADLREVIRQRYAHHFIHGSDSKSALYPGAIELLEDLRETGSLMAIATGKSRLGLDRVLAQTGVGHFFAMTRCADETASKPDPRMLHEILAGTGVHPLQAVMIGDTSYDLEMARRIAMPSLGIRHGAHDESLLHPHAPLAVVDDLPGLRAHLWRAE